MKKNNKYEDLANKVIDLVGGKENITFFTHCITRLRFNVKDKSLVNKEEISRLKGVIACQWSNEQFQIVIGQDVADAYNLICEKTGLSVQETVNDDEEKKDVGKKSVVNIISSIFEGIAGCIAPILFILIGAGMLKIVVTIGTAIGLLNAESPTHMVLTFASDAGFYFLPIFVGATSARKFGANLGLGMLIGAMLLHPSFVTAVNAGEALSVFGLPVYATTYGNMIFPTIMAVFVMSYIEKFVAKVSPKILRTIAEPLVTLIIMIPLTLCLIGPAGAFVGTYLSKAIIGLYNFSGFIGLGILASVMPFLVFTGMHTAFSPYAVQSLSTLGYEPITCPANLISNMNQSAASLAVSVKAKNKELKSTALSCATTAIFGVTEPALYGITMPLKKPLIGAMIGSLGGGIIAGLGHVCVYSFPSGGILGLSAYLSDDIGNVIWMIVALITGYIITFVSTLIIWKEE